MYLSRVRSSIVAQASRLSGSRASRPTSTNCHGGPNRSSSHRPATLKRCDGGCASPIAASLLVDGPKAVATGQNPAHLSTFTDTKRLALPAQHLGPLCSAGFQTCCVAGFQPALRPTIAEPLRMRNPRHADLGVCATPSPPATRQHTARRDARRPHSQDALCYYRGRQRISRMQP
jgi:hypothetical protein